MRNRTASGVAKSGLAIIAALVIAGCDGDGHGGGYVEVGVEVPIHAPPATGDFYEPNDFLDEAAPIWDFGTVYLDLTLWGPGDEDWFSVEGYAGFPITVSMYGLPEDYDVSIIHPFGYVLASSSSPGTQSEWCSYTPWTDDVFYVRVQGFAGASSPFPFTLSITN